MVLQELIDIAHAEARYQQLSVPPATSASLMYLVSCRGSCDLDVFLRFHWRLLAALRRESSCEMTAMACTLATECLSRHRSASWRESIRCRQHVLQWFVALHCMPAQTEMMTILSARSPIVDKENCHIVVPVDITMGTAATAGECSRAESQSPMKRRRQQQHRYCTWTAEESLLLAHCLAQQHRLSDALLALHAAQAQLTVRHGAHVHNASVQCTSSAGSAMTVEWSEEGLLSSLSTACTCAMVKGKLMHRIQTKMMKIRHLLQDADDYRHI